MSELRRRTAATPEAAGRQARQVPGLDDPRLQAWRLYGLALSQLSLSW